MRPEISLVLLTTLSGAGQGLFIFTTLLFLSTHFGGEAPKDLLILLTSLSLVFPGLGGIASFFHLGHPARGWKAIRKWKHSWLSREVILLPLFVGLGALFLLGLILNVSFFQLALVSVLACIASLGLYIASAMLYAAIHFIKEWSNLFTLVNFILMGFTSGTAFGAVVLFSVAPESELGRVTVMGLIVLGGLTFLSKLITYWYNDHLYNPWSLKNALGLNAPDIRLMDTGAAYETYNSHEFHQPLGSQEKKGKKRIIFLVAFLIPLTIWILIWRGDLFSELAYYMLIAASSMLFGLYLERKLFFVQGNHVQNLYYGNFKAPNVKNPLVVYGRK